MPDVTQIAKDEFCIGLLVFQSISSFNLYYLLWLHIGTVIEG